MTYSRTSIALLVAAGLCVAGCSDSSEQGTPAAQSESGPTAEETVAFLMGGFEDGAPLTAFGYDSSIQAKQESKSPATYTAKVDGKDLRVSISQQDNCKYSIFILNPNGEYRATVNFSVMAVGDRLIDGKPSISAKDFLCDPGSGCEGFRYPDGVDGERWLKAYRYFQDRFCKGKPF